MKPLPCALCSSTAIMLQQSADSTYFVICTRCGAEGPYAQTEDGAMYSWDFAQPGLVSPPTQHVSQQQEDKTPAIKNELYNICRTHVYDWELEDEHDISKVSVQALLSFVESVADCIGWWQEKEDTTS